jgi:translation initiation factor IF-2
MAVKVVRRSALREFSLRPQKVFQIARELGVDSKAIIAKCEAEGVPKIDSHLSVVSVGLAATIREWFSATSPTTAVERTAHVDVEKVKKTRVGRPKSTDGTARKPGRRGRKAAASAETAVVEQTAADGGVAVKTAEQSDQPLAEEATEVSTAGGSPTGTDILESESQRPARESDQAKTVAPDTHKTREPEKSETETTAKQPSPEVSGGAAVAVPVPPAAPVVPAAGIPAAPVAPVVPVKPVKPVVKVVPRGIPNVVAKPVVTPVGPRNVPTPAQLQGPKVVRVEAPEPVSAPRPRPRPAPGPSSGPMMDRQPSSGGFSGRNKGRHQTERNPDEEEGHSPRRKGGRNARNAFGRSADAGSELAAGYWTDADLVDRAERLASATGGKLRAHRRALNKSQQREQSAHVEYQRPSSISVTPPVTARELSELLGVKAGDLLKKLMEQGTMVTVNQPIDVAAAQLLALDYGVELLIKEKESLFAALERQYAEKELAAEKSPRPPIVTVLGHVDHGKTSLLDKIRSSNVAAGEAGGITQHIGAYTVTITGSDGKAKRVTFLDTPGHQAFTAMRARGANVTDVVVLVVAADDGVMPQTVESISHAKAANVPIVVALNKIDKPEANANRVLGQLAEQGLNPAEWGGDVEVVRTSAVTGSGVKELIEYLDYVATLRELKAATDMPARGSVVEAFMDPLRGVVARVIVRNGTLRVGDSIVCGPSSGRVRQLLDDKGHSITEAGPAMPVEVIGLDNVPVGGDSMYVVDDPAQAKAIAQQRAQMDRENEIARRHKVTLDNLFDTIKRDKVRELNMILKADVQGSVDVLKKTMTEELSDEVQVKLLHAAVGGITESDVLLADASGAIIVGFSVVPDESARKLAEQLRVEIRLYRVIYEITDDIRKALGGMLSPEQQEQSMGHAEIRQVIRVGRLGNIAGCMVTDGILHRSNKYRLIRDGVVVVENLALESLKRFKDDVREVRGGLECGLKLVGYDDIKIGDRLEAYKTVDVARTL